MNEDWAIPAAHIQEVDLSAADPALAAEIRLLGDLMERGDETPEQFAKLIRLLHNATHTRKAEYLLRRNIDAVAAGPALYRELFGTARPDEFAVAVERFRTQFGIEIEFLGSRGFLDASYQTKPRRKHSGDFQLLGEPCEVRFDYSNPDAVVADVSSQTNEEYLLLQWVRGAWHLERHFAPGK